ncbi:MAG: hypothetical protein PVI70_17015 [Gammaproteobacteria bacterium]
MQSRFYLAGLFPFLLVVACRAPTAGSDRPALIVQSDRASRAELEKTLSNLFGDAPIVLADDALTRSSILTLEIDQKKISGGEPALGRVLQRPYRFQLLKRQESCFLLDMRDGKRYLLQDTSCVPE